jgi:glycerol-3-phosphate O-acyltransferase
MPCPHAVAGKNLFFWPLGNIFRALGAFSIRRTFSGAVLYTKVFEEYIHKLLKEGFNIELFFEGGRSRTGKLMMPKLGFLSILLNAFKNGSCEDMIFVPIFIGYDRVLEESSYLHEIGGGQKKPENLSEVIKTGKFLMKRYGKIYLKFHEPISLNELLQQNGKQLSEMTPKEQNTVCRNLGYKVLNAINRVSVVTPHALVASAILASSKNKLSYGHLMSHVETFMTYLLSQKAMLADTLSDHVRAVENVIYTFVQRKFIEPIPEEDKWPTSSTLYIINEKKRPDLEYYKNNCISFFVPASFTALSILEKNTFVFSATDLHSGYSFLSEFFQNEFAVHVDSTPEDTVKISLQSFMDVSIITSHPTMPDTYNITSEGYKKLELFSGFLRTFFESYWIVLNFLKQFTQNSATPDDRLKKIQAMGDRMYKRMEIERKEALSKVSFSNAEKYFASHGIKGSRNTEKVQYFSDAIQKYMNLLP